MQEDILSLLRVRTTETLHYTVKEGTLKHGQPNFFFHLVTGYSILRAKGVPVGKNDFLANFLKQ
jgi:hypothetical protein